MAFSINTNITSLQAQYYLNKTQQFQSKTINEVTSGLRIVNSGDDAAGLAVANGYRSDQAVLTQGIANLNSATSTMQTIDSGMANIGNLLDRARTLATQSASDTFTGDRTTLNNEFQSVMSEIDRQSQAVGVNVGGTFAKSMQVFVGGGAGATAAGTIKNGSVTVDLSSATVDTKSLGLTGYAATGAGATGGDVATYIAGLGGTGTGTLTFSGAGFSQGATVDVSVNLAGVTDMNSLADAINSGIAQADRQTGTNVQAFKNAGITAVVGADASGNAAISFTAGNNAFQVSAAAGGKGAQILNGANGAVTTAVSYNSGGTSQVLNQSFTALGGTTAAQVITFTSADASGKAQSLDVTLNQGTTGASIQAAVTEINKQLQTAGGGLANIVAVVNTQATPSIDFVSTTSFTSSAATLTGTTPTGGFAVDGTHTSAKTTGTSVVDISTSSNAASAVTALASAVKALGSAQAIVGKSENVMNYATSLASTQLTNLASSESQIRDADLAAQAANLSKAQILSQAGVAALAQANSAPQAILSLLKG